MSRSYIEGLERFIQRTNNIPKEVENDVKELVKKSTFKIEANAILNAPVGESRPQGKRGGKGYTGGRLRQSINATFENDGLVGIVSAMTEYVLYVEFGTRYQPAQLFMTRAYLQEKPKFEKALKKILKRVGE